MIFSSIIGGANLFAILTKIDSGRCSKILKKQSDHGLVPCLLILHNIL